tara:strand:+ start:9985 stop:10248 length:264 start_codon:yes stop_codon:yes gene_type:complete
MKSNKKILRRDFILYFFSAIVLVFFIKDNFSREVLNIDSESKKKIKNYNSLRKINTGKDLRLAIESDHKNNKTIWIGKKLYTFAEVI